MKTITKLISISIFLTTCLGANASTDESLTALKSALKSMPVPLNVPHTRSETNLDDDETIKTVAKIIPSNEQIWELISYNDKAPSKKEIKKYRKQMKQEAKDQKKDPFIEFLNLDSLKHFQSNDTQEIYSFNPVFSAFSEESKYSIDGRVITDKQGKIQEIKINAPKAFKPIVAVKMNTFSLNYKINYHENIPYIQENDMLVEAKAGGFKNITMQGSRTISDIQW